MATKGNIARSGAMGKSFYQSTKSKRTSNHRHRHRGQDHRPTKITSPIARVAKDIYVLIKYFKMETVTRDPKPHEHDRTRNRRHRASRARPPTHKNHMSTIGRADQSQKPHVTKNHKSTHTRTTKDPQRPKTLKVACRAVFRMI